MPAQRKSVLAITGPRSSSKHIARFRAPGGDYEFTLLEAPTLRDVSKAMGTHPDLVVLFGGDGTLNRYLGVLLERRGPVLMVPAGSGNDFALANGMVNARDAIETFQRWLRADITATPVDIGALTVRDEQGISEQRYFSCCVNIGVDAEAVARANRMPAWLKSRGGYLLAGIASLVDFQPQRYTLRIDGSGQQQRLWFIAGLNTPTYGGGLRIAPHASTTDRNLELAMCGDVARFALLRNIPRLLSGKVHRIPFLRFATVERFTVSTDMPEPVCADGEFLGYTPAEVTLAPQRLSVLKKDGPPR